MQEEESIRRFTEQIERFVQSPHANEPAAIARFLAALAFRGDERVLDVACGPGLLARAFAPHVREFVGVDLTPAMVERAGAIVREAGIANARFQVANALALPFEPAAFGTVFSRLAVHHVPDPRSGFPASNSRGSRRSSTSSTPRSGSCVPRRTPRRTAGRRGTSSRQPSGPAASGGSGSGATGRASSTSPCAGRS